MTRGYRIGVVFPQHELHDAAEIRDYTQAAEALGFEYLLNYDHVIGSVSTGADPKRFENGRVVGKYGPQHPFHEPFALLSFMAGITRSIELATAVLILPQRQTALVAKQAAEVDVLSGGRFRLGVGIGWNAAEYAALGIPWEERAARLEEQIHLLRELWTKPVVNFEGRFHSIVDAGINPLPLQRPIPIWLGGMADAMIDRVGRIADGWFPRFPSLDPMSPIGRWREDDPAALIDRARQSARKAGRDFNRIGMEGFVSHAGETPVRWAQRVAAYRAIGATQISFNTLWVGLKGASQHIEALRRFREVV